MNKPLPWNVKGVGFDAREAARLAAKRAGVPLGEWLNTIISARAAELGVGVDDVAADDRLDAIAARLSAPRDAPGDVDDQGDAPDNPAPQRSFRPADSAISEPPQRTSTEVRARAAREPAWDVSHVEGVDRQQIGRNSHAAAAETAARYAFTRELSAKATEPRRSDTPPRFTPNQVEATKLDERLNSILAKLNRSFEAAAEMSADAASTAPGSSVWTPPSGPKYETEDMTAPRPTAPSSRDAAPRRMPSPGQSDFMDLHEAFKTLAAKLEAQLEAPVPSERPVGGPTRSEPSRRAIRSQMPAAAPDRGSSDEVRRLQRELADLVANVAAMTPQRSIAALEAAVRELTGQIDLSKLDGVQAALLAPVERLGLEMRDAIRSADTTEAVAAVRQDMKRLATKLDSQPAFPPDDRALARLTEELRSLREVVDSVATRLSGTDRLHDEIAALGTKVGSLAARGDGGVTRDMAQAVSDIRGLLQGLGLKGGLSVLDQKLDALSAKVEAIADRRQPDAYFADMLKQIQSAHETLADRLAGRMAPQPDLTHLETSVGTLAAKIESLSKGSQDVTALYGLVGNLADKMHDARAPQADDQVLASLQAEIGKLVERLDQTEGQTATLHGLERLVGDLFLQIEQSRNVAIDAAENAARSAAQDTLRAAMDNPSLNGAELTVQTGLDVDHVSQELADLRRVQEAADRRVTTTLTALNTTLERLLDHLVAAPPAPPPAKPESDDAEPAGLGHRRRRRVLPDTAPVRPSEVVSGLPPFDPEQFLIEPGRGSVPPGESGKLRDAARPAPVPQVGNNETGVAPLIAAARRAAQAAQASALEASLGADSAPERGPDQPGKVRSFFAQRRRPLLLGLAGIVLLLGTLQIVRLSTQESVGEATVSEPARKSADQGPAQTNPQGPTPQPSPDPVAPKADKGASLLAPPGNPQTVAAMMPAADPVTTGSITPAISPSDSDGIAGLPKPLRDLATGGNAAAQFEVASRLSDGKNVTRDPKQAAVWFERAAKQGSAPAQYRLGSLYEKGVGIAADPALAVAWYEKAAQQGNIRAMHNLAVMSAERAGSKPDYGKAVVWFTKAASYGVRDSQYNLAVLFARGLGAPQNLGQSYSWFALAAQQGDADAVSKRDLVAAKLDAKTLSDAKANVVSFHALPSDPAMNDVQPPPGGWEALAKTAANRKVEARATTM